MADIGRQNAAGSTIATRLPQWLGSIRLRLALLYSTVVFGLAALVVGGIYTGVSRSLSETSVTRDVMVIEEDDGYWVVRPTRSGDQLVYVRGARRTVEETIVDPVLLIQRESNRRALDRFRQYALVAFVGLFAVGTFLTWMLAGWALRPIGRITGVARDITATDLSRRIGFEGADDEVHELADTFDDMLDRLDTAFEGQRRFIHEASHELRNPIAVIRTNADLALSDPELPEEELRHTIEVVSRSADRMSVLVDDLLTHARSEVPEQRDDAVDIYEVAREAVAEFRRPAQGRSITLSFDGSTGLQVRGDRTALKQALANLLANAVRLAPSESVIEVTAGREGDEVWFAVKDEGPGIDPADQEKVFERFYRGDQTRGRNDKRSGLGLTIVKQIVEGHKGEVVLVSEPGQGSTFSVWIPAMAAEVVEVGR